MLLIHGCVRIAVHILYFSFNTSVTQVDDVTSRKPKRRSFRFSLRTLLVFMLVVCVAVGWKFERVRRQREAVAWVKEMGGFVYYFVDGNPYSELRGPEWARKWLGHDFFNDVTGVELQGTQVSDISPLAKLSKLEYLYLDHTPVSDVTPLAKLTKLEKLFIHNTQVSDQAMEQLEKALPQCEILY